MSHVHLGRPLGVAPLCAIDASIEEYLGGAADAGFDFAGVRLMPVTDQDVRYTPDGKEFRRLVAAVAVTGLDIVDVEVFPVSSCTTRNDWLPVMDMGAQLGASVLNVVGRDPDLLRFTDRVAELTVDAREHGILPVIEPIAYLPMHSYERAIEVALLAGCGVELDGLHVLRTGADPDLFMGHEDLLPILQLCDAPNTVRRWGRDRPGGATAGDDDLLIESRFNRLLPGHGVSPLGPLLDLVSPETPVSVEIPNVSLQAEYSVNGYLRRLYREAVTYLTEQSSK